MTLATTLLKGALFATLITVYWRPICIAKALQVPPPDGGWKDLHAHMTRFLLTFMSSTWALSSQSSWYFTLLAMIVLQTVSWASFLSEQRVLSGALENYIDEATEKQVFQTAAVVFFGLLLLIVLFSEPSDSYRRRLVAFYAKHNPGKISDVDKILKKYEGKEELLFTRLGRKYSVLSHTAVEDAVDDLDHDAADESEVAEREVIEEVEYIQETTTAGDNSEEDDEGFQVIKATVKSPVNKPPSVPASPAKFDGVKPPSVPASPAVKPPSGPVSPVAKPPTPARSPSSNGKPVAVASAIEEARRLQNERVEQRVAQLSARGKKKQ